MRIILALTCGVVGLLGAGHAALSWSGAGDEALTTRTLYSAALAVMAAVVGIVGAGLSYSAQRSAERSAEREMRAAADRETEALAREDHLTELKRLRSEAHTDQEATRVVIREFLDHERMVDGQNEKARGDVSTILKMLATRDLEHKDLMVALADDLDRIQNKLTVLAGDNVVPLNSVRSLADLNGRRRDHE